MPSGAPFNCSFRPAGVSSSASVPPAASRTMLPCSSTGSGYRPRPYPRAAVGLADRLLTVGEGDAILMIAYAPIYREVSVLLDHAEENNVPVVLVGDSLAPFVRKRVVEALPVPRGRADHLAMHGATIVLIEAMIVALAAQDRSAALASLEKFGALRGAIDKLWLKRGVRK